MSDKCVRSLQLEKLDERHPGLTPALAATYYEAAAICFHRHHVSPVQVQVEATSGCNPRTVAFPVPDDRTLAAHANQTDAVEAGAYGVSLAAVELEEELVTIGRTETLSGADWYLAPIGEAPEDLEACYRLEVSGTDEGDSRVIKSRVRDKVAQTRRGRSNLPAIASVVGFKALSVVIERVDRIP